MNKIYRGVLSLAILFGASSCVNSILDLDPIEDFTDATFYSTAEEIQLALNGVYSQLDFASCEGVPLEMYMETTLTDNGVYRITDERYGTQALSRSTQSASTGFAYGRVYKDIARANNILEYMPRAEGNISEAQYNDFKAQALALRAYFYSYLINYFGDVPYVVKPITTIKDGFQQRTEKSVIIDNLLSDLETAAGLVNESAKSGNRVTKVVIYALKARIALYAERYDVAATAADNALEAANAMGLKLAENYGTLFTTAGDVESEILLRSACDHTAGFTNDFPLRMGPRNCAGFYSQMLPIQNLVDAYPTTNGLTIDEDPTYDPKNPWANRDPRMRMSIVFPGDTWANFVYDSHRDSKKTTKYVDGVATSVTNLDSRSVKWTAGISGYLWRKHINEYDLINLERKGDNDVIFMRLGEIYLIKAEAEIERNGGDLNAAAAAIETLRARAYNGTGITAPAITDKSQSALRRTLRIERRIELVNEGFRYIDMLRWGIAEKIRNKEITGRILDPSTATYVPTIDEDGVVVYTDKSEYDDFRYKNGSATGNQSDLTSYWYNAIERKFTAPRDYLWPIPQTEIDLYESYGYTLEQNPEY